MIKNRKKLMVLGLSALAACFLRNNGIIVVAATAAVYGVRWLLQRREKGGFWTLCSILIPLCVYMVFSNLLIPALGITKWRTSEILSLPFQQTARHIVFREDDITEEEKQIIDAVLDYERVKATYDPRLSDPVKSTYKGDEEALKIYLEYWFGELVEHPTTYLSATFNNSYGFFYPGAREDEDARGTYRDSRWDPELLPVEYSPFQDRLVKSFGTVIRYLESLPIFYPLCNVALHVWTFLWIFTGKVERRKLLPRAAMTPVLASVIALTGMPTFSWNGFRYALPVVIAVPFLVGLFIDLKRKEHCPE